MANKVKQTDTARAHASPDGMAGSDVRSRRRVRTPSLFIGLGLALAVATGCSQAISVETLEDELASQIAVQRGVGVSAVKVVCPATVEVAEGSVVECSAVIDGKAFTATITQTDGEGGMQWVISADDPAADVPSTDSSADPDGGEPTGQ